jgi:hypothetical protein
MDGGTRQDILQQLSKETAVARNMRTKQLSKREQRREALRERHRLRAQVDGLFSEFDGAAAAANDESVNTLSATSSSVPQASWSSTPSSSAAAAAAAASVPTPVPISSSEAPRFATNADSAAAAAAAATTTIAPVISDVAHAAPVDPMAMLEQAMGV